MYNLRSRAIAHVAGFTRLTMLVIATLVVSVSSNVVTSSAHADFIRFWEEADNKAAQAKKSFAARKAGNYKAAYKPKSTKRRQKLGGYAEKTEKVRKKHKGVRVAALGNSYYPSPSTGKSLSGGSVRWVASAGCLDGGLKAIVYQVAANFGPVTVNSTCRSKGRNRAVGGAKRSKHLSGDAVDFRVRSNVSAVYAYLRSSGGVGGLKHYGGGLFHIDNGERRSW